MSEKSSITFKNSDSIDHNIYSRGGEGIPAFDIGLISPSQEIQQGINATPPAIERIGCKIHPKMRSYLVSVPTQTYLAIPMREEGLKPSYSLEISSSTENVGVLIPSYDPVNVSLQLGESKTIPLTKRGKSKGSVILKRR